MLLFPVLIQGRTYETTTIWIIGIDSDGILVERFMGGTCITTGTYDNGCVAPAQAAPIPLTPVTTSTTTTWTTTSTDDPDCVVACALQTCPGIATDTGCLCSRSFDIGFCLVGDCQFQYPTATSLASKLCGKYYIYQANRVTRRGEVTITAADRITFNACWSNGRQ